MTSSWLSPPKNDRSYLLANVRIPRHLCALQPQNNGWCVADVHIENSRIKAIAPVGSMQKNGLEVIDAKQGILLSGLVDCHTHLDKAHVGAFTGFIPGHLADAISAMTEDKKTWTANSLLSRVDFSLQTAYAYGVRAMRSHVDFAPDDPGFIMEVMRDTVLRWSDRIELQLSPLSNITHFEDDAFVQQAFAAASKESRIGLFLYDQTDLQNRLLPIFEMANSEGWDIDLHVDEGLDENLDGLNAVAEAAIATKFSGTILCGHCVALNVYDAPRRKKVIDRAMEAGLHFVALPTTNLYLQDRNEEAPPQLRGMAPVSTLSNSGANVSLGADNVRDGFSGFGDFDPMAVLNLGAQIGHLHEPVREWSPLITSNPAVSMGLEWQGSIESNAPADLVLFSARTSGEMNLSPTAQRIVIRKGKWLENPMPDFCALVEEVE